MTKLQYGDPSEKGNKQDEPYNCTSLLFRGSLQASVQAKRTQTAQHSSLQEGVLHILRRAPLESLAKYKSACVTRKESTEKSRKNNSRSLHRIEIIYVPTNQGIKIL